MTKQAAKSLIISRLFESLLSKFDNFIGKPHWYLVRMCYLLDKFYLFFTTYGEILVDRIMILMHSDSYSETNSVMLYVAKKTLPQTDKWSF